MKILELFSGYGTATFALKRLGIKHQVVGYSDIDKYANQVFQQNHGGKQLGDVKLINPNDLEDFDLLAGGFPCQSFSVAGKGLGELDPRGTLFNEIIRIAEVKKPRYMLLENVKGLTNKNHKPTFEKILSELARIGYKVHWKILNTKDYGIPQNRERVWFVCFRERSDYDKFTFPEKEELKIFIKDILEPSVDKEYYLSPLLQERFKKYLEDKENKIVAMRGRNPKNPSDRTIGCPTEQRLEFKEDGTSNSLTSVQKDNLIIEGKIGERFGSCNDILATESISQTLSASMGMGGGYVPKIYDRKGFDTRDKFRENELSPTLSTKMGTGGNNVPMIIDAYNNTIPKDQNVSTTIRTNWANGDTQIVQDVANCLKIGGMVTKPKYYYEKKNDNFTGNLGQLRRLTPKECFRLQGFLNDEVNLNGISDTQKYKLAGNGQSVNVVSKIFERMLQ